MVALGMCSVAVQSYAQPLSPAERDNLASAHFRAGTAFFEARQYADAAAEFERVHALSGQVELLYNAARAWDAAGNHARALRDFEVFRRANLQGVDLVAIDARMVALQGILEREGAEAAARCAAGASASPAQAVSVPSPSSVPPQTAPAVEAGLAENSLLSLRTLVRYEHRTLDTVAPWVLMGVAGVLGGFSIWQGVSSVNDRARVQAATVWSSELTNAYFASRDEANTAIAFGVAAGAFVGVGTAWLIARGPGQRREELVRTASVMPTRGGAMVTVGGAF